MWDDSIMKKALITGITGQDGAYLAEFLLSKGYEVHGIKRRSSLFNTDRIDHLYLDPHESQTNLKLHYGDLTDSSNIIRLINEIQPDEIYNLGAQSHVLVSFESPEYTADVNALGTLRVLEAVRILGMEEKTKIYQASTSELYGLVQETPQSEETAFYPRSPYAIAKLYAYWTTVNYRESYNMFTCNGILFNHESPTRGETFVTRKITRAVSRIALGLQDCIYLGNLDASRDWGHAKDYVEAMYLMLQQEKPEDLVIATGVTTTVREFARKAFEYIGVKIEFTGSGVNETAKIVSNDGPYDLNLDRTILKIDPKYFRPKEVNSLLGDATQAQKKLGWKPKHDLDSIIRDMMDADLELFKRDKYLVDGGHKIMEYHE